MPKSGNKKRLPNFAQMERIREIHRLIQRFTDNPHNDSLRVTDESLARTLKVSTRQIQRDREHLVSLITHRDTETKNLRWEEPLSYDAKRRSWKYTRPVDLSPWIGRMNDEDMWAMLVAQQALAVYSGMPLAKRVSDIFEEGSGGLARNRRSLAGDEITQLVSFHPDGAANLDPEVFATLFRGLVYREQLAIKYRGKADESPRERVIHPYRLVCYRQQWRLIALDAAKEALRVYVVTPERMHSVRPLGKAFKRPSNLNLDEEITGRTSSTIQAKLRISGKGMHYILERQWKALKGVERFNDHVVASFAVPRSNFGEFERFVLAFGRDCEVLEPAIFRKWLHDEAAAMSDQARPNAIERGKD